MGPPNLTPEQRARALEKAAEARRRRAEVREMLMSGSLTLAGVLERADADELVAGMKVRSVLQALPGLGKVKSRRLMEDLDIAENRSIMAASAPVQSVTRSSRACVPSWMTVLMVVGGDCPKEMWSVRVTPSYRPDTFGSEPSERTCSSPEICRGTYSDRNVRPRAVRLNATRVKP